MTILKTSELPLNWSKSLLYMALAVVCFHIAYTSIKFPFCGLFIFGYAFGLIRLADQPSVRRAFYFGLALVFYVRHHRRGFFGAFLVQQPLCFGWCSHFGSGCSRQLSAPAFNAGEKLEPCG